MKLVSVCREGHTGEERICIHTLELHPAQIERFQALGMIRLEGDLITLEELRRIRKALRLRRSLGVTMTGAAIILELLERIENLESKLRTLQESRVSD